MGNGNAWPRLRAFFGSLLAERLVVPKVVFLFAIAGALLGMGGCAATPNYGGVFSASETIKGSSETIPASADVVWSSALELVAQQGFITENADAKGRVLLVTKEIRNKKDKEVSHTVRATMTLVPVSDQLTRVLLSANQTTELHKKSYVWWHLLWVLPLVPIGTEYTTVVTDRDTVRSPEFYQEFFTGLAKMSAERKGAISPPAETPPSPPPR